MNFDHALLMANARMGYQDTMKVYGKYYGYYYGSYYGYGQDGADEAQDELMLDVGSKTDATAAETETAALQQSTEEKGDAK